MPGATAEASAPAWPLRWARGLVRRKEPWGRYGLKAGALLLVMLAVGVYVASRYRIGVDPQTEKCLPGYTFFLVDTWDQELARDKVYSFRARGMQPFFRDGTRMVKILRGMPGDAVEIDKELAVRVNGREVGRGLPLAGQIGAKAAQLQGSATLAEGRYWFMGENPVSFDSRYWGTVQKEQIIGRAYPLF
ncbi:MAG: S26 family signal peptidase [Acidovorax sp.]|jgi:conjugal transfer pilin signal peptidase TrbI|nr:S26 family signal peptidase [Acidovorax sp.]